MKLKLFGKSVFEFKKGPDQLILEAESSSKGSKFLPDFSNLNNNWGGLIDVAEFGSTGSPANKKKKEDKRLEKLITPKEVYTAQMLNDTKFEIKAGPKYVDAQIEDFKEKLNLIKSSDSDMRRGVSEIASILVRMKNRKKYKKFKKFYDNYAYTTTTRIDDLIKKHSHLKLGTMEQFIADLPTEATREMKVYTSQTEKLCDKKPIFYIIANKTDFEKSEKRRDPILLAQSPFGHFWQILGAWDEEMLLLEEL